MDHGCGLFGYLGAVFLHGLEVEEGDVDQVSSIDDSYKLAFYSLTFTKTKQLT